MAYSPSIKQDTDSSGVPATRNVAVAMVQRFPPWQKPPYIHYCAMGRKSQDCLTGQESVIQTTRYLCGIVPGS